MAAVARWEIGPGLFGPPCSAEVALAANGNVLHTCCPPCACSLESARHHARQHIRCVSRTVLATVASKKLVKDSVLHMVGIQQSMSTRLPTCSIPSSLARLARLLGLVRPDLFSFGHLLSSVFLALLPYFALPPRVAQLELLPVLSAELLLGLLLPRPI